jgi:HEAT repeat protein
MNQSRRHAIAGSSHDSIQSELAGTLRLRRAACGAAMAAACFLGLSWLACESYSAPLTATTSVVGPRAQLAEQTLQARLNDDDIAVRLNAAEECLNSDPYHVPALRELLAAMDDSNAEIRYFAVSALGSAAIDNPQAQFALHWAFTDSDKNVAITASLGLSQRFDPAETGLEDNPCLSPEEISQFVAKLRNTSAAARQTAAIKLGMCGPAAWQSSTALRKCLTDADVIVRLHAAHALYRIEHQAGQVVPVLIHLLRTTTPPVNIAAVSVLGEIGPAAAEALPALENIMLSGGPPRVQLHLACMILRIDPNNRELMRIVAAGLSDNSHDVRYLAALALGCNRRGAGSARMTDAEVRSLRAQAAAEDVHRLHARVAMDHHAVSARSSSNAGEPYKTAPNDAAPLLPAFEDVDEPSGLPEWNEEDADRNRFIASAAPADAPSKSSETDDEFNPEEGLKPIGQVGVSIRIKDLEPQPPVLVPEKIAEAGRLPPSGTGFTRGFTSVGFGWDAPAVCFRPLYFEDINVERYGIHCGFCEIAATTARFTKNVLLFPYKLLVQPGCENIYTLGYERPNNCIPLFCYRTPCPECSLRCWIERHRFRPYRAAHPFDGPDGVCGSDCNEE